MLKVLPLPRRHNRSRWLAAGVLSASVAMLAPLAADDSVPPSRVPEPTAHSSNVALGIEWTAPDVARMASAHSPAARLLELERSAVGCGLDREDADARARVALIQAVLAQWAQHERNQAAAEALGVYHRTVAVERQRVLLDKAAPLLDALQSLGETAQALDLPDGDLDALADRRLESEDQWFQADFGRRRLRNQLASLTGQPLDLVMGTRLTSPLSESAPGGVEETEALVQQALSGRADIQALETLCRCLNRSNLPAARSLFAWISPGLGNEPPAGVGSGLLSLHAPEPPTADLQCRRSQCQILLETRRQQVRTEVVDAALRVDEARSRVDVAQRRVNASRGAAERARQEIALGQETAGADVLAELEALANESDLVERELELAEAAVSLRMALGQSVTP